MASRAEFRQNIVDAFSVEDLMTLCADLGVDADRVPGRDKGKDYWVDQLITYFERRNETPALLAKLRAERPIVDWAYVEASPVVAPDTPTLPVKWLAAAAGAVVLIVVAIIVLPKLGPGAAPTSSTSTPLVTTIATLPPTAVPTVVAERMPDGQFNILFVDFGQRTGNTVISSTEGVSLSVDAANSFKAALQDASLQAATQVFGGVVWTSQDAAQHGWPIGPVGTVTEAQQVAERVGAKMVVYGNFVADAQDAQNASLDVGFYVAPAENAADEIVGPYRLSAPIPVHWPMTSKIVVAIRLKLNERNKLLSRFAVGLAYDLFGKPGQALQVFQNANASLTEDDKVGRDVLYFFIAREHLLLQHTQEAEQNHLAALKVNPEYARAHLGLGDVYLQYAAAITEPQVLLDSDALRNAEAQYSLAEQQAALSSDVPQLVTLARLGLRLVKETQAYAHYQLDQQAEAKALTTESVRLLEPALQALGQRPEGQRRTLALGYISLAEANWTSARLTSDSAAEIPLRNAFYEKADEAYKACIALDVGTDSFLTDNIVSACKGNQRRMSAERPE